MLLVNMELIQATKQDIDAIMAVEAAGFEIGIREDTSTFMLRLEAYPEGFLLLKLEDKVVGYFCSEIWEYTEKPKQTQFTLGHDICSSLCKEGTELYISSMSILPEYRGKGQGGLMFKQCMDHMLHENPNISTAILIVNESWKQALSIYKKYRFVEIDLFLNFFTEENKEPQDGVVMRLIRTF